MCLRMLAHVSFCMAGLDTPPCSWRIRNQFTSFLWLHICSMFYLSPNLEILLNFKPIGLAYIWGEKRVREIGAWHMLGVTKILPSPSPNPLCIPPAQSWLDTFSIFDTNADGVFWRCYVLSICRRSPDVPNGDLALCCHKGLLLVLAVQSTGLGGLTYVFQFAEACIDSCFIAATISCSYILQYQIQNAYFLVLLLIPPGCIFYSEWLIWLHCYKSKIHV